MRIPKYRRRSSVGAAAFIEYQGRRISLPGRADSPESLRAYHEFCQDLLTKKPADIPPPGRVTIADLALAYLDHASRYYLRDGRPSDEYHCLRSALRPAIQLYGDLPAERYGPAELRATRDAGVASGWSRGYANHQAQRLRRVWRWGVAHELVPPACLQALEAVAPLRRGRTGAREPVPVAPVPELHVGAAVACLAPALAAMVQIQALTGMRSDNLCRLRLCDVDRSGPVWLYRPASHKGAWRGRGLAIPLGPRAQEILSPWLDRPADVFCFSPREGAGKGRGRYDSRTYRRAVVRACRRAGIPPWTPHRLRHTVATTVRARYGLEAAQVYLGHARADVTQVYAERDLAAALRIAAEMG